jgi:hypothetical protein
MANGQPGSKLPPAALPQRVRYKTPNKYAKLRGLKCFKEVHEMLVSGWPVAEVAQYVQKQRGEYIDVTEQTLVWTLTTYRKDLPPGELVARTMPGTFKKAAERVRKGLDELAEMEKLYELQMLRINIDLATEKKINKLIPTMTNEIKTAKDILVGMAQLKMDLGVDERHLGKLDIDAKIPDEAIAKYGRASVGKVLNNPESRRKLLSLVEKFTQIQSVRSELGADGDESGEGTEEGDALPDEGFELKEMG